MRKGRPASQPPPQLSALILAGGDSRRMGRDKAWVRFGGQSLLCLAAQKARALGCAEIFISGRRGVDYSSLNCPVLFDLEPGFGPLGGIERGLRACNSPLLLVLAVDLPRMTTVFLKNLIASCDRLTGAVPLLRGRFEPLAAIYPKRCHALASLALAQRRSAARDFVEACLAEQALRTSPVSAADAPCFKNCNTPADLSQHGRATPRPANEG